MTEHIVHCGCGRTMTLDALRGRGAYRCGCGVRIRVGAAPVKRRACWYGDCRLLATTPAPVQLCPDHEKEVAASLAHIAGLETLERYLDSSDSARYRRFGSLAGPRAEGVGRPVVYFMRREQLIKIGFSTDLRKRAQQLNSTVIAKMPGSRVTETQLHQRFASLRRHGEWFEAGPELIDFINEVRRSSHLPPIRA